MKKKLVVMLGLIATVGLVACGTKDVTVPETTQIEAQTQENEEKEEEAVDALVEASVEASSEIVEEAASAVEAASEEVSEVVDEATTESSEEVSVEVENPMTEHESVEELSEVLGFEVKFPETVEDFERTSLVDYSKNLAEARYENKDGATLTVRKTFRTDDKVDGVYIDFNKSINETIAEKEVTLKAIDDKFSLATWENEDYMYSVYIDNSETDADNGVDKDTFVNLVSAFVD